MGTLSEHAAKIRSLLPIEDVIGQYVDLKRLGGNFKGLCPFHQEKTPSFTVTPARGAFHCFGCKAGGDLIAFIQKAENVEFIEALEMLSQRAGIPMPERLGHFDSAQQGRQKALLDAAQWAAEQYRQQLEAALQRPDHPATTYLASRGLDRGLCSRFGLGLAPDSWEWLASRAQAQDQSIPPDTLVAAGILGKSAESQRIYDRFKGRLIFPIRDLRGRVVALAGRVFLPNARPEDAKYINSPESEIYHKGSTLYGLSDARDAMLKTGRAILTEGYLDVMRAHAAGFTETVATCGTALTEAQARHIKRFASSVLFAYDGDQAGQDAMLRSTALLLAAGLDIKVIPLGEKDDPDSFIRREGAAAFAALIERAPGWLDFFLKSGIAQFGNSIDGRAKTADRVLALVARMPHPVAREACQQRVASILGVSPGAVEAATRRFEAKPRPLRPMAVNPANAPVPATSQPQAQPAQVSRADMALLRLLVESVRARAALLPILQRERLHEHSAARPILETILSQTPPLQDDYHRLAELLPADHPLQAVLSAIAVDTEPLDDSQRTLDIHLARLRREKSLAQLRAAAAGLASDTAPPVEGGDEPPDEPHEEVTADQWDQLADAPPAATADSDPMRPTRHDLEKTIAEAHRAATEAVEQSRVIFDNPGQIRAGRG